MGSWAFLKTVDLSAGYIDVYTCHVSDTTNNRTEMLSVLNAIDILGGSSVLEIFSDSGYVVNGYCDPAYLDRWRINGWVTSTKKPVLNKDLWERFLGTSSNKRFHLNLIKGHKKDKNAIHAFWNDICDRVCTYAIDNITDDKIHIVRYTMADKTIKNMEVI